jgi:hypothetical protein
MTTQSTNVARLSPNELSDEAERQLRAVGQARRHLESECTHDTDTILATFADEGPYAYGIRAVTREDGSSFQTYTGDLAVVREAYDEIRKWAGLERFRPTTQIGNSWYAFFEGVATATSFQSGELTENAGVVLLPTMGGIGITGELFWNRRSPEPRTEASTNRRLEWLSMANSRVESFLKGDVEGVIAHLEDGVQYGLRGYLADDEMVVGLDGKAAVGAYFGRFFSEFSVEAIDVIHRHVGGWYIFAEQRWTVRHQSNGARAQFRTAEFADVETADGRIHAIMGNGTPLTPLA